MEPLCFQYLVEPECVSSLQVILVATADNAEGMQQSVRRCFRHEVNMKTINEDQRKNLISETLHGVSAVADEVFFLFSLNQN
jgi:peroxin-6